MVRTKRNSLGYHRMKLRALLHDYIINNSATRL
jgi:hypothetical protein